MKRKANKTQIRTGEEYSQNVENKCSQFSEKAYGNISYVPKMYPVEQS